MINILKLPYRIFERTLKEKLRNIIDSEFEVIVFIIALYLKSFIFMGVARMYLTFLFFAASLGVPLLIAAFLTPIKRNIRIYFLVAFDLIISMLYFSDAVYSRYYHDVLSVHVFAQSKLVEPALFDSIVKLIHIEDIALFLDTIALIFFYKKHKNSQPDRLWKKICASMVVFILGAVVSFYSFYHLNKAMGNNTFKYFYDRGYIIGNLGLTSYHGLDLFLYLNNNYISKKELTLQEKKDLFDKLKSENGTNNDNDNDKTDKKFYGKYKGKNLIIIQLEAFQNMMLDYKIDGQEVTPNLNKFKKRCLHFNNYYTQVGAGNTSDAEFAVNNSFYPLREGSAYFRCASNKFYALGNLLTKENYDTFAMHGYKKSYWNRASIYPVMGLNKFYGLEDFIEDEKVGPWGVADGSFFRQSFDIIKNKKNPFFSFIISVSSHSPFGGFENINDINPGKFQDKFFGKYIKAMNYADKSVGPFLESLEQQGLMENSIIVIYGDHDAIKQGDINEIMGEFNLGTNEYSAAFKMKNVPLMIHFPKDEMAGVNEKIASHIDILPTLANLYGMDIKYFMGKDILNIDNKYVASVNGDVTNGKFIYVKSMEKSYDYKTGNEIKTTDEIRSIVAKARDDVDLSNEIVVDDLLGEFDNIK